MKSTPFNQQTRLIEAFGAMAAVAQWGNSTKRKYRRAVNYFEEYLDAPAAIKDVSNSSLKCFQEWIIEEKKRSRKYARDLADSVRSIVNRIAPGNLPHGNADTVLLFDAEQLDTIENVLVNQYFPSRMKIANVKTERMYAFACSRFAKFLGRSATLDDLNDQTIGLFMRHMRDEGLSAHTINGYWAKLRAFWTWCAKRRMVEDFPTLDRMPEPMKVPRCWTLGELDQLIKATSEMKGEIAGIPAGLWWKAIHLLIWDTGERRGAVFALRWQYFNSSTSEVEAPAEIRKGGQKPMLYKLKPPTVAALELIREPSRELIFPWDRADCVFDSNYQILLKLADLPYEKGKTGLQKMRRSFASHIEANGGNATAALDHTARKVTTQSYLDPRVAQQKPANILLPNLAGDSEQNTRPGLFKRLFSKKGGA